MESPIVWAEVDLQAIAHNARELRRVTRPEARLMAVVKANAYGHGMPEVAGRALQNGADRLGVARLNEAVALREAGFKVPVLIFGYTPPSLARKLFEFDLTQTVYAYETAEALSHVARKNGKKISVHLKVDTGMGRLGLLSNRLRPSSPENEAAGAVREAESIARLTGLEMEGIYTHFATADCAEKSFAEQQFALFMDFLNDLRLAGLEIPIRHAANSGAIIDMPETHLDMVRAGISLYGLYPSEEVDKHRISLKPAMALKARVVHLKKVPAGFKVSYGCTYETAVPTTIATIPVGYADGFNRRLSSRGRVLVAGQKAPIIGRVCMDQTMVDVGHIPRANVGDEVVIFGRQNNASLPVEEVAADLGTINYEIVSALTARVPRIYSE